MLSTQIRKYKLKTKLIYLAISLLLVLIIGFLTIQNMYNNTHVFISGKVINRFMPPTNRSFKPAQTNILITVLFENNEKANIGIPIQYNPQIGDVYKFEIHESIIFNRKKFIIKQ